MKRSDKAYWIMVRIQENPNQYFNGRTWSQLCSDFSDIEPNPEYLWKILNGLYDDGYIHIHNSGYGDNLKNHIWLLGGI